MDRDKANSSRKLMLISLAPDNLPLGGRELLSKLNQEVLRQLYGENFRLYELAKCRLGRSRPVVNTLRGHIDGLDQESLNAVLAFVQSEMITTVFVDGSNLGAATASVKQTFPSIEVVTFFHNVEARFFWGSLRLKRSLHAFGVFVANYLAERKAIKYSDKVICLSGRDSKLLKKIYDRGANFIAPMVLQDKCPDSFVEGVSETPEPFALFVGGAFYANQAGIEWFVREVMPRIDIPIYIVGRGFDGYRNELEIPGKVVVVGAVDCLADWYRRAQFVIAPIFDGSGMKTKVAEALMYGKRVVGTPEAFSGYEEIVGRSGWMCQTSDEFVSAIQAARTSITSAFDPELRRLYEEHFSLSAATARLAEALGETRDFGIGQSPYCVP